MQKFKQDPSAYLGPPLKKEYYDLVFEQLKRLDVKSILDIGCASGDFFYFLGGIVEKKVGIDISEVLISHAKLRAPDSEFRAIDVLEFFKEKERFDAVFMAGTLNSFMEYRHLLKSLIDSTSPKLIIIQSPFNINPIDTRVMHVDAYSHNVEFQCAYCLHSIDKLVSYLEELGATVVSQKYQMQGVLTRDQTNPMRNYHVNIDGEKCLTNGASIIIREFIITANFPNLK
jgi:2-polyprenyl-3-methyl-5-hydroxy-6-metoxy-1,4-benzoquinol methylase